MSADSCAVGTFAFQPLPQQLDSSRDAAIFPAMSRTELKSLVDGCTRAGAFWRIIVPIARVNVIVAAALGFIMAYGDLAYGLALMSDQRIQPATVALYGFVGAEYADWQNVMAFAAIFVTPIVLAFLALQKQIVRGLTAGAIK